MKIYYNDTSLTVTVNDNSYRYRAIKGDHTLTLYFSLPQHVELPVGAYCVFEAQTYTLEAPENFKMHSSRNFEYTVVFEASQSKAKKYKFRNPVDRRLKFNLTATPREHLQMLIDNMNRRDGGWTIGRCIDALPKTISYSSVFCFDALTQQADAFETEYEINGKEVSLWKVEYNKENPLPLSYGRGNGFKPGVGRTNLSGSKPVEVLFVEGGDRNIDSSKYKSTSLLLPKNQTLRYDGQHFEGQEGFDAAMARAYISDPDGVSIQRADRPPHSKAEASLDLTHIYPSRVGEVTAVEVTKEGFCDFFDTTIPDTLDFSTPESRFKGETMTIIFQSGMLAGKEFEIQQTESRVTGYIHSERRFKVVEQTIDGEAMPKGEFMPIKGDKYAVFGVALPDAYILDNPTKTGASWDMMREAVKYLYENEEQKFTFTGELDGIWAKKDWLNVGGRIKLGGYVLFSDPQFQPEGVGIRIVGVKDFINNPHSPTIELSNAVVGSSIMSDLRQIESNEVVTDTLHKEALRFTKRRFRDAQETISALEEAMEANFANFSDAINPITIKTMSMLVGDESLQFVFVRSLASTATVAHNVTYNPTTKQLTVPSGFLQHKTIGINEISTARTANDFMTWALPALTSAVLTDSAQRHYLYASVSRTAQTGAFIISPTPIETEGVSGHYHLLVGVLNREIDNQRSYVSLHGYTEILPGRITTDRIVSADGRTYFDLAQGRIGGSITFESGSEGLENLAEWQTKQQQINGAQATATSAAHAAAKAERDAAEAAQAATAADAKAQAAQNFLDITLPAELAEVNRRLDGVVENWYSPYTPSLANAPASGWTTDAERARHIGDAFTSTQPFVDNASTPDAGKSWRWVNEGGYRWTPIADSDAVKALLLAAQAQADANGKSRTFVTTPTPPYAVGDVWTQGAAGDLMRCIVARLAGSYTPTDWERATRYTDDSAVENLQIGGTNLLRNTNGSPKIIPAGMTSIVCHDASIAGKQLIFTAEIDADVAGYMELYPKIGGAFNWAGGTPYIPYAAGKSTIKHTFTCNPEWEGVMWVLPGSCGAKTVWRQMLERGNKPTDWSPAPEDQAAAAEAYAIAAAEAERVKAQAYADGIVTAEEERAIADATAKANAAKEAAEATAKEYTDGIQIGGTNIARATKGKVLFSTSDPYWVLVLPITEQPKSNETYSIMWDDMEIPNNEDGYGVNVYFYSWSIAWNNTAVFVDRFQGGAGSFTVKVRPNTVATDYYLRIYRNNKIGGSVTNLRIVRGDKPMLSWSPAPEDVQAEIDAANAQLSDIASDNKLTGAEKQETVTRWTEIGAERPSYIAQGQQLAIDTAPYEATATQLQYYLNPLFQDLAATSDINGEEFRAKFKAYYDARAELLQAIADATKAHSEMLASRGKIYLRGTGLNRNAAPIVLVNNVSILTTFGRGLTLAVLKRDNLEVVKIAHHDIYGGVVQQNELAADIAQYDNTHLIALVSYDAIQIASDALYAQIARCGGVSKHLNFRIPYALLGIPDIGEGNGLEVYTSDAPDAPYAEISTQVINGTPLGMMSVAAREVSTATARLAEWASDAIISPTEKTALRAQRAQIVADYAASLAEAQRQGVATTAFTAAYNAAIAAIDRYTATTPESIAIEADYDHIAAYYTSAQGIRNAVGEVSDLSYLKKAFANGSTTVAGGVVLSEFIGIKEGENVVAGMTKGSINSNGSTVNVPLLFAGADNLLSSMQTAVWSLDRSGVQKSRNKTTGATVTISDGGISFHERKGAAMVESMSMTPDQLPVAFTDPFVNAGLITESAGNRSQAIAAKPREELDGGGIGSGNSNIGDPQREALRFWRTIGEISSVGSNTTFTTGAFSVSLPTVVAYQDWIQDPNGWGDQEAWYNIPHTANVVLRLILSARNGDTYALYTTQRTLSDTDQIDIPATTRTALPSGNYDLQLRVEVITLYFAGSYDTVKHYGYISHTATTFAAAWAGGACHSKIFGNGFMFSKKSNQYCGIIGNDNNFIFEQRSGDVGFRADAQGAKVWCPARNEWIPADRVLYRGWVNRAGIGKQWSYNNRSLRFDEVNIGAYLITLPTIVNKPALVATNDFMVRCTGYSNSWIGITASPYYHSGDGKFTILTSIGGDMQLGEAYFEVIDVTNCKA